MLPHFLRPFAKKIKSYEREFIRIEAIPTGQQFHKDSLGLKQSKFLGKPFFPADEPYPKDVEGDDMILAAQINFSELPSNIIFPDRGIFQLYLSPNNWYNNEVTIKYWKEEDLNRKMRTDFSFIQQGAVEEIPIYEVLHLQFSKAIDHGGLNDESFDLSFNGLSVWDFEDTLNVADQSLLMDYFDADGHKLGGYASFTQSDPRSYDKERRNDFQILQMDTDEHMMFGDSGIAHVFIDPLDLEKRKFEKAWFYWDCC